MERNTEERSKLKNDQLAQALEITQELIDMWTKSYQSTLGKLAQVPTFGPVREKQEKIMKSLPLYSQLYTAWIDSSINLQSVLLEATRRTFEKTVEYQIDSIACAKDGKSCVDIEKYKEFYKIWIDAYSETFKKFIVSDHYASDTGKFSSLFIDFQKYNREMFEENVLKPNNLPTKTDMDDIYKELYELRKIVKSLTSDIRELLKGPTNDLSKEDILSKKSGLTNREEQMKKIDPLSKKEVSTK